MRQEQELLVSERHAAQVSAFLRVSLATGWPRPVRAGYGFRLH
jgi:hypothetical protein